MRKTILFLFALFVSGVVFSQINVKQNLIGKWGGVDSTKGMGTLKIIDSINVELSIPDQGIFLATYIIDTSKIPMPFDIIFKIDETSRILQGLLKFLDTNTLKWQIFIGKPRPDDFTDEKTDNTITLTKQDN